MTRKLERRSAKRSRAQEAEYVRTLMERKKRDDEYLAAAAAAGGTRAGAGRDGQWGRGPSFLGSVVELTTQWLYPPEPKRSGSSSSRRSKVRFRMSYTWQQSLLVLTGHAELDTLYYILQGRVITSTAYLSVLL